MNQRIKQFERDSGLEIYGLGQDRVKWKSVVEKFAQLIVQECAKVILETPVKYTEIDIMHIIRDNVKVHFGVEE